MYIVLYCIYANNINLIYVNVCYNYYNLFVKIIRVRNVFKKIKINNFN